MFRQILSLGSLTFIALSSISTTFAQAQTPTSSAIISIPVEVTNISRLERRPLGGHKAKVTYKINLPAGFQLKQIAGDIEFKLTDGKVQKGNFNTNTNKVNDTIEIAANGQLLAVDQEPVAVKATIKATAEKPFNGFTTANFRIDGTKITEQDGNPNQFPLDINITRISDFKRQALGGHQVRVHYQTPQPPADFTAKELRVKATFKLAGGKTQTNTVVRRSNIRLSGNELVDTNGQLLAADGETRQIDTQVAIDGQITKSGANSRTETCGGGECKR